ncbi:MAG TPA: hypothetical protein VEB67_00885, partial [Nitrososphaerales archaeon]|nr:hypothetical protein [Nitrososphaerales archaeon]
MLDLLSAAIAVLGASALLLPLMGLWKGRSGSLAGYALAIVLAVVLVLVALFTMSPAPVTWANGLLAGDQLGGIFALVTVGVTLAVTIASFNYEKATSNP